MFTLEEHLKDLADHIGLVRAACHRLGSRLLEAGDSDGVTLIARGHVHDQSKFHGIEWDFLHVGKDVDPQMLILAVKQHTHTNSHHPEFHGGIHNMPRLDLAEMVCDTYARSQEFASDLRDWWTEEAVPKYKINRRTKTWKTILYFMDLLLRNGFK